MGVIKSVAKAATNLVSQAVNVVDNTVQSIEKNPITAIADIAAVASGNPELVQYINPAIAIAQGADPTKVLQSSLVGYGIGQVASGIGSDVTEATDSQTAGNIAKSATNGALRAVASGGDPLSGALASVINNTSNSAIKDATGASWMPSFNVAGTLMGSPSKTQTPTATTSTGVTPTTNLASDSTMPNLSMNQLQMANLALPQNSMQNLGLTNLATPSGMLNSNAKPMQSMQQAAPLQQINKSIAPSEGENVLAAHGGSIHYAGGGSTLKIPTVETIDQYTQIDPTLDPVEKLVYNGRLVTPNQMGLLATEPVVFSASGGSIEDQILPELLHLLKERGMTFDHHKPKGYAEGSEVEKKPDWDWKAMKELSTPQFAHVYEPRMLSVQSAGGAGKLSPLTQLDQGPLSHLIHHAHGGDIHKYEDAAPEGHHPEFITGVTGYYASGGGTGQSDDIPAMLRDGDYVIDADAVAALGDGSSKAGYQSLMHFKNQFPHHDHHEGEFVPAQIADGEVVLDAPLVTAIGGGDNKRGAKMLDAMREELRAHKRAAPDTKIPPKAKSPLEYLKMAAKG